MKSSITNMLLTAIAVAAIAGTAVAGPHEDGVAAQGNGDYAKAFRLLRPLALQGDAGSQFHLSLMYANGQGIPVDSKESLKWLRLSARQGNASAQSNLGVMYSRGRGVAQDRVRAYAWLSLAADSGNTEAISNRDIAKLRLTPQQIIDANALAAACLKSNYQGCY